MRVFLNKHWSDQFGFEEEKSSLVFVGRDREVKSLKHVILNNTSSTTLVSSIRGMGKTSFVQRALADIRNEIIPVFVNVGHTLREDISDEKDDVGRVFLTSLIRASYLSNEFKNDADLLALYHKSIGKYLKQEDSGSANSEERGVGFLLDSKGIENTLRLGLIILGTTLGTLGITTSNIWLNILGYLGLLSLPISISFQTSWLKKTSLISSQNEGYKIDNSTEYLEAKFEQWLEKQSSKDNKKLVFVVDELDRIDPKESFDAIKEYKNLFARSFAHFIFISNQQAYELTQEKRAESKYPTLFTHVYYLPIASSSDMNTYLETVFSTHENSIEFKELKKYLLFKAANEFFTLKNMLNDFAEFDEDNKQFIDTETLKRADKNYADASTVYDYIDCFYKYYSQIPKHYWLSNSKLQEESFSFIHEKLMKDFHIDTRDTSDNVLNLVLLLHRIGVIASYESTDEETGRELDEHIQSYSWTGEYRSLETFDQLFKEDEEFIESMELLMKVANDIESLPLRYEKKNFSEPRYIQEGKDGSETSGVNLYSTYKKFIRLYYNLKKPEDRLYAKAQAAIDAKKEIDDAIEKVSFNQFETFGNILETALNKQGKDKIKNTPVEEAINSDFAISSWQTKFTKRPNRLFSNPISGRQVLLISGVLNFDSRREIELAELKSNNKILVLNFYEKGNLPINPSVSKDIKGRHRKPAVVKNFINFIIPMDIRSLADPLKLAMKHLD